ncbi:MAG: carboxymuconolactone decarboxylase family protein [Desulfobacterales bacterium]|nr:carboxymuconolactone decarboxylase family protein [Deltaproteobacteria bacterium]NNL41801.1 carboxymuconolactone decarboxylase family protein [Desulfobacterales bacterium]NNL76614.1 carboxymuconolactone decarboxylase family protein [Desulfobacterales bacterium]
MFPDIDEIKRTRKKYNWKMSQSGVQAFRKIEELEVNALKDGALSQKYKELIALGISISNTCYG